MRAACAPPAAPSPARVVRRRTDIVHAPVKLKRRAARPCQEPSMTLHLSLAPLIALLAGILILVRPKLLATIVAVYLIIVGVLGLFPGLGNVF
jgi:hypothetical protein